MCPPSSRGCIQVRPGITCKCSGSKNSSASTRSPTHWGRGWRSTSNMPGRIPTASTWTWYEKHDISTGVDCVSFGPFHNFFVCLLACFCCCNVTPKLSLFPFSFPPFLSPVSFVCFGCFEHIVISAKLSCPDKSLPNQCEAARLCHRHSVIFHCSVQSYPWVKKKSHSYFGCIR